MRLGKHILSVFLVVALLSAGLPVMCPEDADLDSRVDLSDAILHMKSFARTAEAAGVFGGELGKLVSTLRLVAGCQSYIGPVEDETSLAPLLIDQTYLVSSYSVPIGLRSSSHMARKAAAFSSVGEAPQTPPPQDALV